MTNNEYQMLAARTECDQLTAHFRIATPLADNYNQRVASIRVNQASLGITKEGGELLSLVEKSVYYGQPYNRDKAIEELGDVLWYCAQLANSLGVDLSDVMAANIRKLQARYPERFTEELAKNRDLEKEAKAVKEQE